jgi:hypothetical protein
MLCLLPHLGQVPVEDGCIGLDAVCQHGVNHAARHQPQSATAEESAVCVSVHHTWQPHLLRLATLFATSA